MKKIWEFLENLNEVVYVADVDTHEWVANGITPEKDNLQNLPPEICANWYRQFCEDKNIIIEDLEDIRESDPLQYDNLKR